MTQVQASAPGKLYIAGEYAVVDGAAAIVAAVNRFVTVAVDGDYCGDSCGDSCDSLHDSLHENTHESSCKNTHENLCENAVESRKYYGVITSEKENYKPLFWTFSRDFSIKIIDDINLVGDSADSAEFVSSASSASSATAYAYVLAAMQVVKAYAYEKCAPNFSYVPYNLRISSELDDAKSGRKYGLGSSAAVTVATVRALCEWYGLEPETQVICKLALISSAMVKKSGSGGDVAASAYGGWVLYRAYNRNWLEAELSLIKTGESDFSKLLRKKWPRLEIKRLNVNKSLKLLVGWTGSPASSAELVSSVENGIESCNAESCSTENSGAESCIAESCKNFTYADFCAQSEICVQKLAKDIENFELDDIADGFAKNRELLQKLGALTGTKIETSKLTQLINDAVSAGFPAKTSGAGGGDCGIALATIYGKERISFVKSAWKDHGIMPLNINVTKIFGSGKPCENIVRKGASKIALEGFAQSAESVAEQAESVAEQSVKHAAEFAQVAADSAEPAEPAEPAQVSTEHTEPAQASSKTSVTAQSQSSITIQRRKDEHIALADAQYKTRENSDFDTLRFMPNALPQLALEEVDSSVRVLENKAAGNAFTWRSPLYINAMTGGSAYAQKINAQLARVAAKTGVAMASGSLSAALKDSALAGTFSVIRSENPSGFVMANVSAGTRADDSLRAVKMLQANALQVHLNAAQELVMPEGDRDFRNWLHNIERIVRACEAEGVPVIVKETGCGMTACDVLRLRDVGVRAVDVSGRGGTNFVAIENARRSGGSCARNSCARNSCARNSCARNSCARSDYDYLASWGLTTVESLLNIRNCEALKADPVEIFASGGVRSPLDVVRALALGASGVGVAGEFLHTLMHEGEDALTQQIADWQEQIRVIMALLGCKNVADLREKTEFVRAQCLGK